MSERTPHRQRPPDVEAALSSMLWTPYERTTPTNSCSSEDEDDDERLNRTLRKSHSSFETSLSSQMLSLPLPPPSIPLPIAPTATPTAPRPLVPFPHFSLSAYDAAIATFDVPKHSGAGHRNRNRYSYPYYGSPAHTLTNWCSSAATAIKEPPSYESLYEENENAVTSQPPLLDRLRTTAAAPSTSTATTAPSNIKSVALSTRQNVLCDRSQRSPNHSTTITTTTKTATAATNDNNNTKIQLTAQVPADRLVRSFTDDYISQNCTSFHQPAAANVNSTSNSNNSSNTLQEEEEEDVQHTMENKLKEKPTTTNARSQQNEENQSKSSNIKANCIINEHDGEQEMATSATTATQTTTATEETGLVQVNQPVSCAAATPSSHCASATATETETATETATVTATATATSTEERTQSAVTSPESHPKCSPAISLSSSFGACTTVGACYNYNASTFTSTSISSLPAPSFGGSSWLSDSPARRFTYFDGGDYSALRPPNKCLAELERLYAEFRASESIIEHKQKERGAADVCEADLEAGTMRLNVPAHATAAGMTAGTAAVSMQLQLPTTSVKSQTTAAACLGVVPATTTALGQHHKATTAVAAAQPTISGNNSSSVFLNATATNSSKHNSNNSNNVGSCNQAAATNNNDENSNTKRVSNIAISPATKSCQRQPSLTIQVNNNNNNNNNNSISNSNNGSNNGNHVCVAAPGSAGTAAADTTTTTSSQATIVNNNNGVCVVNCNYTVTPNSNIRTTTSNSTTTTTSSSNNNNNNNNSVVEINSNDNSVAGLAKPSPAKVFSASVQNKLNNNTNKNNVNVDIAVAPATSAEQHVAIVNGNVSSVDDNSVNIINVNATAPTTKTTVSHNKISSLATPTRSIRTFTSTECQTDDLHTAQLRTREQRRRERREPTSGHSATLPSSAAAMMRLPDILHSHYPPPYSALPVGQLGPPPTSAAHPQPPMGAAPLPPPPPPPGATILTPIISTVPLPGATPLMSDGRFTLPLPIMRRSPSERSGKGCCGQWFAGPPLRALIAVVALGGVACALAGAALGATGLAGPPNSQLTAALLMIGVGVVLVTVSGAAWRMTAPGGQSCLGLGSSVDLGRCGRRPCSRGGGAPHGLLYPEFQHRPPPPSYQASMQEYRLRLLLLDRDRQNGVVRGNSPPPTYRSHAGSLLRAPLTTLRSGMGGGTSSSMGGSEYSLPPSYRSRNATPATVCSERTIETAPSGRLLANEDLPEPSTGAEQLADYSTLQSNTLLTSAIVEIESSNRGLDSATSSPTVKTQAPAASKAVTAAKDLVTIVTISQANSGSSHHSTAQNSAVDQIDILAHL
ncbi:mucin-5AC [Scaptodrosophila lebanonensis]|uniref:Mucin-5AC n=1 Tax=Drosophila lebanonensis TaxID=7225 RepID=A0A6J2TEY1_DROLE|nr:mucin-5AC [Scaptodrosophila lebanonensis]